MLYRLQLRSTLLSSHFFSDFRKIVYNDLVAITPEQYFKQITKRVAEIKAVSVSLVTEEISLVTRDIDQTFSKSTFTTVSDA